MESSQSAPVKPEGALAAGARLLSVDALRGFDMFWIIGADQLVKSLNRVSESGPAAFLARQFRHVRWDGFVFYDLIFPLFVFIIGISIVFSMGRIIAKEGMMRAHVRLVRRFILLFLLGVFYDEGVANLGGENVLCGVLQRLALCYFFTSLLFCRFKVRGLIVAFLVLILGYWALFAFVPVPSTGVPSIERDKFVHVILPDRNWTHDIDNHMPPYYDTDPEGYLSTFPAVGSCLLGVFAGLLLVHAGISEKRKVLYLIAGGAALTALGYFWGLHWGLLPTWSFHFPIIKKLWTSSYVLVAGGYSCMLLGVFYLVVDVWKCQKWAQPFVWIGCNPLTIYLAVNLVDFEKIARRFVGGGVEQALGRFGPLTVTLTALALCILLVRFLYQKRIFLRV